MFFGFIRYDEATVKQARRYLLVIAEVQNLSLAAMEELRLLSNIVAEGKSSIQTLLFGQPQFRAILASKDWSRFANVYSLLVIWDQSMEETHQYIKRRGRTVEWQDDPVREEAAVGAVHGHSGGIPRRINTLCSRVLLTGAPEEIHTITRGMVDATTEELNRDLGAGFEPAGQMTTGADDRGDLLRRIEMREQHTFRQKQVFKQVSDLLESNVTEQS
jgi:general secretion pathway protein A